MAKSIKALYENGVFKPLAKVRLKNRQRVELTVVENEKPPKRIAQTTANRHPVPSPVEVACHPAYRIVALFKSGVHDLSARHDNHLYR
jgi:predicted DNA-binding antitoxin AbrB/MazE fold protein